MSFSALWKCFKLSFCNCYANIFDVCAKTSGSLQWHLHINIKRSTKTWCELAMWIAIKTTTTKTCSKSLVAKVDAFSLIFTVFMNWRSKSEWSLLCLKRMVVLGCWGLALAFPLGRCAVRKETWLKGLSHVGQLKENSNPHPALTMSKSKLKW